MTAPARLQRTPPPHPLLTLDGYSVLSLTVPAQNGPGPTAGKTDRPSGDLVGAAARDSHSLRLWMADLQGKGTGAGPYHDYLDRRLLALLNAPLVEVLACLHRDWPGDRFASVALLDVDTRRHHFTTALAGHPDPVVRRLDGSTEWHSGCRFGLVGANWTAEATSLPEHPFPASQWVLLFSDGALDAGVTRGGERFGKTRLLRAIRDAVSPQEAIEAIHERVFQHLRGHPLEDDLSLLLVARRETAADSWAPNRCQVAGAASTGPSGITLPEGSPSGAGRVGAEEDARQDSRTALLLDARRPGGHLDLFAQEATPRLFARAKAILHNDEDARDCVQETLLRVTRHIDHFDLSRSSGRAWCFCILQRLALNIGRR